VRRWRALLWIAAGLLLLAAAFGAWLLHTEAGLRFVVARAQAATPGLSIASVSGTLGGTVRLGTLRYDSDSLQLQVQQAQAELELAPLIFGRITLALLDVRAPQLILRTARESPKAQTRAPVSLPSLRIRALSLRDVQIVSGDTEPMRWTSLQGGFAMQTSRIDFSQLELLSDDYLLSGDLAIDLDDPWWVQRAQLALVSTEGAPNPIQARLSRTGPGAAVPIEVGFTLPLQASLSLQPGKRIEDFILQLSIPSQDATRIGLPAQLPMGTSLAITKSAQSIVASGAIELGPHRASIGAAQVQWLASGLKIDALPIDIENSGTIQVQGLLPFSSDAALALQISTASLKLQPDTTKPIDVAGRLVVSGTYTEPGITADLQLHQDGLPPGALTGSIRLTPQTIHLDALTLALDRGQLMVDGDLARDAAAQAKLVLRLDAFDPGLFAADWPGQLSGDAQWMGSMGPDGANGTLGIERIAGQLRAQPLHLDGQLQIADGALHSADIDAQLGDAQLQIDGEVSGPGALSVSLNAPDLAVLHPDAQGRLKFSAQRSASWRIDAEAQSLQWRDWSLDALTLSGTTGVGADPAVDLDAKLVRLQQGEIKIALADLHLLGTEAAHALRADIDSDRGRLAFAANGSWNDARWSGVVESLDLVLPVDHDLRLQQPVALEIGEGRFELSEACLSGADTARICMQGQYADGAGQIAVNVGAFPLEWLGGLGEQTDYALQDAVIEGEGVAVLSNGHLHSATLKLHSAQGRLLVRDRADLVLGYRALRLDAQFDGSTGVATAATELLPEGHAEAHFALQRDAGGALGYDGTISVLIKQLDAIEAFTTEIANPSGQINGQFRLQQDAAGFRAGGAVALSGFKAEVPSLGLSLKNGSIALAGVPDGLILRGAIQSGDGVLTVDGRWTDATERRLALKITGENVRLSNTPELLLIATPDLQLDRDDRGWNLVGTLDIPRARIQADQLSGGATQSADVVVVDDPADPTPDEKWRARVTVRMGDDVQLKGFGFDGKLRGQLAVNQSNGRSAIATGQLGVTGLYNAYGQKLNVARGELLYAGSRLDEPAVSVRAERKIGDSTAGIEITGTASRLVSRVYARPAMSESEALSLLVTGRRLRDVRGGDANRLSGAALALGTIGGDMLARNLGLDELGVSSNSGLQGEAFTIGKYLSPRLYVGYGIGLLTRGEVFTVRYLINDRVDVEANIGERQRAAVNYRIER
jgi:translocation and assembly module TamB